jgi:hypothetical protein
LSSSIKGNGVRRSRTAFGGSYWKGRRRETERAPVASFRCAKANAPITIGSKLQLELAIQCSLDPAVRALEYLHALPFQDSVVGIDMIVADFDEGRFVLDIVDDRPLRDLDSEGLHLLAIAESGIASMEFGAEEILAEPFASNCRHVWKHRTIGLPPPTTASIAEALRLHASMQIGELSKAVRFQGDILPIVFSMACADLVELDLASGLDDRTIVSTRRPALASARLLPGRE